MAYSITIVDRFTYHRRVLFGLNIQASEHRPFYVGCSLRTRAGHIVDLPARWVKSPGLALWKMEAPNAFQVGKSAPPMDGWNGLIIFALYRDDTQEDRLADTGWQPWSAPWLVGSSGRGLDMQDEMIRDKYGHRQDVWLTPTEG